MSLPPLRTSSSPLDALVGGDIGKYRVEERLGAGGMGVVYRATDRQLGREVALKFLSAQLHADPNGRGRLLQEARAAAALDHPHVASVYDVGETEGGRLYVAMAFYDGETLAARLERGPLDVDEAVDLVLQIASGLGAAHYAGIVHRDVKAANVMVLPSGMPDGTPCAKVLDFGIAKVSDADLTQTGESLGTAFSMSPEQLRGEPVDARADVWAVGVLLYEMLTGRRPFGGAYAAAIGYAVLHEDPPPLSAARDDLPDGLAGVVERCLAKAPTDRYASMDALADDLRRVRQGSAHEAQPPTAAAPAQNARAPGGVRVWHGASAALAVVVVAALAWIALRLGAAEVEVQRLAVLPFQTVGDEAGTLSEGLVEAVTSKLSHLAPLEGRVRIVPASEVPDGMTPSEARERFGVSLVIDGTVQVEGGRVRVTITLIDVGADAQDQLGSREIDNASGSAFALQDAAVLQVADLLRVEVAPAVRDALAVGSTEDPAANALYLRGRGRLRNQQSVSDLDRARSLFQGAISRDPEFALAYAALAEAEWQTYRRLDDVAWADRAVANARRALELDDELAEAHVALGAIYTGLGKLNLALESLNRALALSPRDAEAVRRLAKVYAAQGRTREAEAAFEQAVALAPDFWRTYNSLGVFYLGEGRAADAVAQFRQGLTLDPVNLSLLLNLGVAAWLDGDLPAAAEAFERVLSLDSGHSMATANLATVRFTLGDYAGAVETGEQAVALQPDDYETRAGLAEARWWTPGQRGQARDDYHTALALAREHLALGRSPDVLVAVAGAFAHSGRADSARVYLNEIEQHLSPETADVQSAFKIGVIYELVGERSEALAWLRSAFRRGYGRVQASRSPWLADLRKSPAYQSLEATSP